MGCHQSKLKRRDVPVAGVKVVVEEGTLQNIQTSKGSNTLTRVNQYKLEQVLGKGSFGAVYRAADTEGVYVAIKVMEKGELRKKSKGIGRPQLGPPKSKAGGGGTMVSMSILKEIAVMKRVSHPNCVRLFEVIDDPAGDRIFLVMDLLLGGEVLSPANLPTGQAYLNEEDALEVFRDLLDGLEYLHGNGILHRDIKPENMVYAEKPRLNYKGGETSLRKMMSAAAHLSTAALEKTVNVLESATGLDIDGDGDVGVAGHGNSTPRLSKESVGAAPSGEGGQTDGKGGSLASRLLAPLTPRASGRSVDTDAAAASSSTPQPATEGATEAEPAVHTPRTLHTGMTSGGRAGDRTSYLPPVKLLDFGVSQVCVDSVDADRGESEKKRFDDSILKATGTPLFFSPEMCHLPPIPYHGRPADVWATGVTLCMLVSGELPFTGDNMPEIWRKVQEEPPELDTVLPKHCTPLLRDILRSMLEKDPNKRPTVKQLRSHPWVTREGEEPMPEQPYLPLEITDDDIKQAVKHFGDTFSVLKAGQKWKKATFKKLDVDSEAAGAAGGAQAAAAEATTAGSAVADADEQAAIPKRKPSLVERQLSAAKFTPLDRV